MMLLACVYVEIEVDTDMNWSTHATGVLRHQGKDNKNMLTHKYVSIKHIKAAVDPFSGLFGCTFTSYCLFMARFLVAFTQIPKINNQHLPESFFC